MAASNRLIDPESGVALQLIVDGEPLSLFRGRPEPRFAEEAEWNYAPIVGEHRFSRFSLRVFTTRSISSHRVFSASVFVDGQRVFSTKCFREGKAYDQIHTGKEEGHKVRGCAVLLICVAGCYVIGGSALRCLGSLSPLLALHLTPLYLPMMA